MRAIDLQRLLLERDDVSGRQHGFSLRNERHELPGVRQWLDLRRWPLHDLQRLYRHSDRPVCERQLEHLVWPLWSVLPGLREQRVDLPAATVLFVIKLQLVQLCGVL